MFTMTQTLDPVTCPDCRKGRIKRAAEPAQCWSCRLAAATPECPVYAVVYRGALAFPATAAEIDQFERAQANVPEYRRDDRVLVWGNVIDRYTGPGRWFGGAGF
jgi:ribosomal protein L37AE/L43A